MMQTVRTSAAIASLFVAGAALNGCDHEEAPPTPRLTPSKNSASVSDKLEPDQQVAVRELADRITHALKQLPRVSASPLPATQLRSPNGVLATPDIEGGVHVWSEVAAKASLDAVTRATLHECLPLAYESLNQLYLYATYYRSGHINALRQQELFVLDGHPRDNNLLDTCASEVTKSDVAMHDIAAAIRGIQTLATDLKIPLREQSPLEREHDSISLKPGAQKALKELLGFGAKAIGNLNETERMMYLYNEAVIANVLGELEKQAGDIVVIDIHDFTDALTLTSIVLLTDLQNQEFLLAELVAQGNLENEVHSKAAKAKLDTELGRVNVALNRRNVLNWQLEYLAEFAEKMNKAAGIQVPTGSTGRRPGG